MQKSKTLLMNDYKKKKQPNNSSTLCHQKCVVKKTQLHTIEMNCSRQFFFSKKHIYSKLFEWLHDLWTIHEADVAVRFVDQWTCSVLPKVAMELQNHHHLLLQQTGCFFFCS